jgi:hypothetical protein
MEQLNWGYLQLGLVALAFGGLQIWWISSTLRNRALARPLSNQDFRKTLERIWTKDQQTR